MPSNSFIDAKTFDVITREVCGTPHVYDTLLYAADSFAQKFLYGNYFNGQNEHDLQDVKNIFLIRVYREIFHSFYFDGQATDKQPEELEKWLAKRASWAFTSYYQRKKKEYDGLEFIVDETPKEDEAPRLTPLQLTDGSPEDALVSRQDEVDRTNRSREQVRKTVLTMLSSPSEPYIILACLAVDLYYALHPDECKSKKDAENMVVKLDLTLDELAEYDFTFLRQLEWLGDLSGAEEEMYNKLNQLQENGERLGDSRLSDYFGKADGVTALSKWTYVQGKSLQRKLGIGSGKSQ